MKMAPSFGPFKSSVPRRWAWGTGVFSLVTILITTAISACSPPDSSSKPAHAEAPAVSTMEPEIALADRAASVASMPRAKTASILGLPTDLLGNGRLRRGFTKRDSGVLAGIKQSFVGRFSSAECVTGNSVEKVFSEGGPNGFVPMPSNAGKTPSEILGFDVKTSMRGESIESDLAEFLKGDENSDLVFYNPASYLRGTLSLEHAMVSRFDGERCGMNYVERVAYVGRIFVVLKVQYGSPQDRAKIEERLVISNIELSKLLTEIKRDPGAFRSLVKFSMAAYQVGGDVTKLAANLGGASHIECTPDDLIACEGVFKNLTTYSTDLETGFPSQLDPRSVPGPMAVPVRLGDMMGLPAASQTESLM